MNCDHNNLVATDILLDLLQLRCLVLKSDFHSNYSKTMNNRKIPLALTVIEFWQKSVLLPHGMVIINGFHCIWNVANHAEHAWPICIERLKHWNCHLTFCHACPNMPIIFAEIFIDSEFSVFEDLHQLRSIQHDGSLDQIFIK